MAPRHGRQAGLKRKRATHPGQKTASAKKKERKLARQQAMIAQAEKEGISLLDLERRKRAEEVKRMKEMEKPRIRDFVDAYPEPSFRYRW